MSTHPNKKIVLTGASGGIGSAVLKHLEPLVAPSDLVLGLHDLNKAPKKLVEAGATAFKIDYSDPPSLDKAFKGASIVFLVSYPSIQHQERFQMHKNAIDAAIRQRVQHIFYTSLAFGGNLQTSSLAFVMQAHLSTEAYLASVSASLTYTAIREGLYSESYSYYFGFFDPAHPVDEVYLPTDEGAIAFAARDELGEATAKIIHAYWRDGPATFPYINQRILLSGLQPVTLKEVGVLLGKHLNLGKPIRIRQVSVDEYVQRYRKQAAENKDIKTNIREWATSFDAIKAGETAVVSSVLQEWLGREPERFETTLAKLVKQQIDATNCQPY